MFTEVGMFPVGIGHFPVPRTALPRTALPASESSGNSRVHAARFVGLGWRRPVHEPPFPMGIPFDDELTVLAAELERAGFGEPRVVTFPYVPARRLELHLAGGLVIRWDRFDGLLFVDGPKAQRRKIERFLESREKHALARMWSLVPDSAKALVLAAVLIASSAYAALHFRPSATPQATEPAGSTLVVSG